MSDKALIASDKALIASDKALIASDEELIAQIRKEYPLFLKVTQYAELVNCSRPTAYHHFRQHPDLVEMIGSTTRVKREKAIELIFKRSPWVPKKDRPDHLEARDVEQAPVARPAKVKTKANGSSNGAGNAPKAKRRSRKTARVKTEAPESA